VPHVTAGDSNKLEPKSLVSTKDCAASATSLRLTTTTQLVISSVSNGISVLFCLETLFSDSDSDSDSGRPASANQNSEPRKVSYQSTAMSLTPQSKRKRDRSLGLFDRSASLLPTSYTQLSVQITLRGHVYPRNAGSIPTDAFETLVVRDMETARKILPAEVRIDATNFDLHTYACQLQQLWVKERWS
jgi:hypothetical protein